MPLVCSLGYWTPTRLGLGSDAALAIGVLRILLRSPDALLVNVTGAACVADRPVAAGMAWNVARQPSSVTLVRLNA